jgi:hypothetical protein
MEKYIVLSKIMQNNEAGYSFIKIVEYIFKENSYNKAVGLVENWERLLEYKRDNIRFAVWFIRLQFSAKLIFC